MKRLFSVFSALILLFGCIAIGGCKEEVKEEVPEGKHLFDLDEAYRYGLLTGKELKSVAYYYYEYYESTGKENIYHDITPIPKEPETLSEETVQAIQKAYLKEIEQIPDGDPEKIRIVQYYGTYRGSIVTEIYSDYFQCDLKTYEKYEVGGVTFNFFSPIVYCYYSSGADEEEN